MAKSILPGVVQGLAAVGTAPASLADLAAKGVSTLAQKTPPLPFVPSGTADAVTNTANSVSSWLNQPPSQTPWYHPSTYNATMGDIVAKHPELGYEAQTFPGKVVENAGRVLPSVAMGGEGALPTLSRTLGSAIGTTTADKLSGGNPWAMALGGIGGYGLSPTGAFEATTPRAAMAKTLQEGGVPVSAAEITGSPLRATLEGQSMGARSQQITNSMLKQGVVVRPQGNTEPISSLIAARGKSLGTQVDNLTTNTSLPVSNNLWNNIGNLDLQHTASGTGAVTGNATSLIDPAVHQAYEDFSNLASGTGQLTGKQYRDLSEQWGNSNNPTIRQMGNMLDAEMEKANPEWSKWNEDWANYKGLKAASDAAGGAASTGTGLDPTVVRKAMYKPTPMRNFAEAAEGIVGGYPKPYSTSFLDTAAALLGAGAGVAHGSPEGVIAGVGAGSLAGALHVPSEAFKAAVTPLFRTKAGQKLLMMDPKSAAAALYGQSSGVPAVQTQGGTQ
jgi:hypothetical protein